MNQSLKKFKEFYLESLLSFLWAQWTAMGVPGYGGAVGRYSLDPEALLLLSCSVGRYDSRLFDEVLNWLNANGGLINVQRLKKIMKSCDFSGAQVLSAIASFMAERHKFLKWAGLNHSSVRAGRESLFFQKTGQPMIQFGPEDPCFLKQGYGRGRVDIRKNLSPLNVTGNNCLILKLRLLFGINARSEIILYLLTKGVAHPARVAGETYYSQKTAQDTLVELARSGLVRVSVSGREKMYWLDEKKWADFLTIEGKSEDWVNWPIIFFSLEKLWLKLNQDGFLNLEPALQSSEIRELMRLIAPKIEEGGLRGILSDDKHYQGEAYLPVFEADIKKLMEILNQQNTK